MDVSDAATQQKMTQTLRKKFDSFDKNSPRNLDWIELNLALKSETICTTDDEVVEIFSAPRPMREHKIQFEQFVARILYVLRGSDH